MNKVRRGILMVVIAVVAVPLWALPAGASQCQDPGIDGYCALQRKLCAYGSTLQEKYGVGWDCIQ
ncbi:MAG: hypothetical protein M3345_02385 [Actinomycetota bacterium]|nr:hypothetical protein [Actinomycetota bacterium]